MLPPCGHMINIDMSYLIFDFVKNVQNALIWLCLSKMTESSLFAEVKY